MSFFPWAFDTPHFNFTTHHPVFFRTPDRAALRMWSWLNWEAMANEEESPKWWANHKNAKRQGVKACLRPVWNITALRQTWKSKLHGTVWQYLPTHCNVWSAGIVQDQGATKASKVVTKSHFSPGANFRIAPKSCRLTLVEFLQTCQALETTWNH